MDWLEGNADFRDYLRLTVFLNYVKSGMVLQVILSNTKPTAGTNEYPHVILGAQPLVSLGYVSRKKKDDTVGTLLESNMGLFSILNKSNSIEVSNIKLLPGKSTEHLWYQTIVKPDQWASMKETVDQLGIIDFIVDISVPFTYRATSISYDFLLWHQQLRITANKVQMEEFISNWTKARESFIELPENLPSEALKDMVEASKCIDVEASRAGATMVRRALEQVLIDKGADRNKDLYEQIDELKNKKQLTAYETSLAHGIRYLGNFGAHPEDDQLKDVNLDDAKLAFQIVSKIMRQLYPK
jgi:hypothetical protein